MALIQLNEITKSYGNKVVLNKFSLKVKEGEFIALTGASGRGKSTILNIIGLLEGFDDGELVIDGNADVHPNSVKANKLLREKINYLFQNFALIDDETVSYNLQLALKYVRGSVKEKHLKMQEALGYVGLQGFEKYKIYELSGGEQQRVAIARSMLKPCKIILADEPTGSLDEENRNIVLNLLKALNNQGKTIVLVTHDQYMAGQCQRVINL
ncbi:MAG: ABC transporter ATP-binding protein [Clostridia bacterium]|nr:ABC transporter ATP-binding protein [Clostridia bacterium]